MHILVHVCQHSHDPISHQPGTPDQTDTGHLYNATGQLDPSSGSSRYARCLRHPKLCWLDVGEIFLKGTLKYNKRRYSLPQFIKSENHTKLHLISAKDRFLDGTGVTRNVAVQTNRESLPHIYLLELNDTRNLIIQ